MTDGDRLMLAVHAYPDGGGISSIVDNYVAAMRDRYEIYVVIVEARQGWERLREAGAQVHVLGYSNAINPLLFPTSVLHSVRIGLGLRRIVSDIAPRLLITQDALHLAVPAVIATIHRDVRLAIMDHGTLTNVHEPGWLPMLRERLGGFKGWLFTAGFKLDLPWRALRWRIGAHCADQLWLTGAELEPWFGRAHNRVRRYSQSIPADFNPVDDEERAWARKTLGLPPEGILINSVGRLDGEKGWETIVAALDHEGMRSLDFTLAIAGDGSLGDWLRAEVSRRQLDDRVCRLGRLDRQDVVRLQNASDVHLYAGTFSCGVSICVLEAMAAGVPPIASDQPSAQRELIGDTGWVFVAGDVQGLRAALITAIQMPRPDLRNMGIKARAAVHSQPDPTVPELVDALTGR